MNIDIPLDGTNVNEVTTDKDGMSLLIMRQAFLDAIKDTEENDVITDEVTDSVVKKEEE